MSREEVRQYLLYLPTVLGEERQRHFARCLYIICVPYICFHPYAVMFFSTIYELGCRVVSYYTRSNWRRDMVLRLQ